jgi:hypothetical protein
MKKRGRPKKIQNDEYQPSLKQDDKVKCITHPGIWTLVWYKEGDETCAIQNETHRCIVKTRTLTKITL